MRLERIGARRGIGDPISGWRGKMNLNDAGLPLPHTFKAWEREQLRDPEFVAAAVKLEAGYQVARLRMHQGLTQRELARRVGTWQPSIARLESGKREPRLSFLRKVLDALGADLDIRVIPRDTGIPCDTVMEKARRLADESQ
jgi:DNA-binding XRE family transcriptional regulator